MRMSRRRVRRIAVVVLFIVCTSLGVLTFKSIRALQQQRLMTESRAEGLAAYRQGDLEATLNKLSYFFEHVKDDLEVNLAFADARARVPAPSARNLLEAVDLYSSHGLRLITSNPNADPDGSKRTIILQQLLRLYSQLGQRLEIIETADRLLAIEPDSKDALAAKMQALCLDRRYQEAMPIADRLIKLEPDNLAWRRSMLEIEGETGLSMAQRIEQCRTWASQFKRDGRFHILTAGLLVESDRLSEARQELDVAANLGASDRDVLSRATELMDLMDLRDQADALIAATIKIHPQESWPREVLVTRLWHSNELDKAQAALSDARSALGAFPAPLQKLQVLTSICQRNVPQAQRDLAALEHDDKNVTEKDRSWATAVRTAISDAATWRTKMDALRNALSDSPNDPVLHSLMGDGWAEVGEQSQAVFFYEQAFRLDPQWMAAGVSYGSALLNAGRLDEAYTVSRQVVTRSPRNQLPPILLYARAFLAVRAAGRAAELVDSSDDIGGDLISILQEIREDRPHNAEVAGLYAEALCQFDHRGQAEDLMKQAAGSTAPDADVLIALAQVAARHKLDSEMTLLRRASQLPGAPLSAVVMLSDALARHGDAPAGLKELDSLLASAALDDQQRRDAVHARVEFMLAHQLPGALAALNDAVTKYPGTVEIQQLALAYPAAWPDANLTARVIDNLQKILGDDAPQVRLAQANSLLHNSSSDEARLAKAIVLIEGVLEQSPNSLAALSLMADAAATGQHLNLDRAIECLEHAVALYSDQPDLVVRLVSLLQQRGDFDKAGRYLRSLARFHSVGETYRQAELRLWQKQGDVDAAIARASSLVNDASPVPEQLVLAAIQQQAGRRDDAERIYQRLLNTPDPDPLAISQAAEFFANTGRFQRGFDLMSAMKSSSGSVDREVIIGSFCRRHGDSAAAEQHLLKAVADRPNSIAARTELARLYLDRRASAKARDQALAGLRIDQRNQSLRAILAVASLNLGGPERSQAIASLREIGGDNQDLIATLSVLQSVPIDQQGKPSPTRENLAAARRLIEEHGRFLPAWQLAIMLNAQASRTNDAIQLARNAVSRFPGEVEPAQDAVQLLVMNAQWRDALADAQEWRRRTLDDPIEADTAIASILIELNRADDAQHTLAPYSEQIQNERAQHPERLATWVRALALSGQYERAASIAAPLLKTDERWRQVWLGLVDRLDPDHAHDALAALQECSAAEDEQYALIGKWIALGRQSACSDCFDRALTIANQLQRAKPDAAQPLLALAAIAEAREQWPLAESLYRQILARDAQHPLALNNLAWVLSRNSDGCAQALPFIQKAIQLKPDEPDFLDTYAHVLLGMDRAPEAESVLKRALSLKPDDLSMSFTLIEAQILQGHRDGVEQRLMELKRQMASQQRTDPDLQRRFDDISRRLAELQAAAGT